MKVIFYKSLWFLFIFIISFMPIFGQTYVSTGSDVCLSTISRNPTGSYPVHYMKTGPYSGKIMFSFTYMNNIYSFKTLPITNYNVNDISVVGNTIYFCGEDSLSHGFYGVCKRGSGVNPPYYIRIYKLYNADVDYITSVQRIRVFCDGADTNVLLIGNYLHKVQNFNKSAIVHIKNNSVCTVSYGSVEHFDDVEVLDDYVVAVARKGGGGLRHEPHYMRVLNKSSFSLYDTLFDYYYGWDRRESTSRILLQKTNGDSLVSVYHTDNYGYYFNTYAVNSNGILQLYNYTKVDPAGYHVKVSDVSYNSSNRTLSIVHNSDTIGYASHFSCSSFPAVSYVNSYSTQFDLIISGGNKDTLLSVAPMSSNGLYVTGIKNNKMLFWKMPNGCDDIVQFNTGTTNSQINSSLGPTIKTSLGIHQTSFQLTVGGKPFTENCSVIVPFPVPLDDKE